MFFSKSYILDNLIYSRLPLSVRCLIENRLLIVKINAEQKYPRGIAALYIVYTCDYFVWS